MHFSTFLFQFGINPDNFVNKQVDPIPIKGGFVYELDQKQEDHCFPQCGNMKLKIKDYKTVEIESSQSYDLKVILRIKKVRLYCSECKISFTPDLEGIS